MSWICSANTRNYLCWVACDVDVTLVDQKLKHVDDWITFGRIFWNESSTSSTVWPDLTKFYNFGYILKLIGKVLRRYLVLCQILNLLWQKYVFEQIFIAVNKYWKLSSHLGTLASKLFLYLYEEWTFAFLPFQYWYKAKEEILFVLIEATQLA